MSRSVRKQVTPNRTPVSRPVRRPALARIDRGVGEQGGEGGLLAPSGVGHAPRPRPASISRLICRVACGGNEAMVRARSRVSARTVPSGQARRASPHGDRPSARDPLRGEQDRRRLLPSHPGRQQVAAGRLGRDAHLGERRPQAGRLVHQHEVDVAEDRAARVPCPRR